MIERFILPKAFPRPFKDSVRLSCSSSLEQLRDSPNRPSWLYQNVYMIWHYHPSMRSTQPFLRNLLNARSNHLSNSVIS